MNRAAIQHAVEDFWLKRSAQDEALEDGGKAGGGARANGHMGTLTNIVAQEFHEAGLPSAEIHTGKPYLPGYYRARKQWDIVVKYRGILVAAIEMKSQIKSVQRNINNRFEEALGTATDTHAAQAKNQAFGEVPPWLGYVFILAETTETETVPREPTMLYPCDPAFHKVTYNQRYQEMLRRFIGDNIYQAGWFITSKMTPGSISYTEPLATATALAFQTAIRGRLEFVKAVAQGMSTERTTLL
ncbi:PaeR7I family type II restriction endonuclease [Micromonospora sp. NPDC000089]|uniref:PaeR7I family type II restriction endonuclease n=1 Tax=unclassified Micromonospora TaxID=2617518 RepID=UPI0036BC6B69